MKTDIDMDTTERARRALVGERNRALADVVRLERKAAQLERELEESQREQETLRLQVSLLIGE
jgi:hypothetical protein